MRRVLALLLCATALLLSSAASATLIEAQSIEQLAADADAVISGVVVSTEPYMDGGRIYTRVTVDTDDGTTVEIMRYGGRTERLATAVAGAEGYRVGERVVVLAQATESGQFLSMSMAFSKFEVVERDGTLWAIRSFDPGELVVVDPATNVIGPTDATFEQELPLSELLARIEQSRAPEGTVEPTLPGPDLSPNAPESPVGQ